VTERRCGRKEGGDGRKEGVGGKKVGERVEVVIRAEEGKGDEEKDYIHAGWRMVFEVDILAKKTITTEDLN